MSFGEFEQSFDVTVRIDAAAWQGTAAAPRYPLLPATPSAGETVLEMLGADGLAVMGGNHTEWGLYASGLPVGEYGAIPVTLQLGLVSVPVVTSRVRFTGELEIRLFGGTVAPTATVDVRVKGARVQSATFREQRLARWRPQPTPLERLRSAVGTLLGVNR